MAEHIVETKTADFDPAFLEDRHVLATFKTPTDWARKNNHSPRVARVRHLNDKKIPDHEGAAKP